MEQPPHPCTCCHCQRHPVVYVYVADDGGHGGGAGEEPDYMVWLRRLVAEDFSATCARDRACAACGGAAFCAHCCSDHHRDHAGVVAVAAKEDEEGIKEESGWPPRVYRRDSFCITCRVAFCSELCAHHGGGGGEGQHHEVMRIDEYGGRHFARCTGAEPWFHDAFDGIQTFEGKDGNLMIPLRPRPLAQRTTELVPETGLKFRSTR